MTLAELIEVVVTTGHRLEISHEGQDLLRDKSGNIVVRVLSRANIVEGEIEVDLDDEDGEPFGTALENFLCHFW